MIGLDVQIEDTTQRVAEAAEKATFRNVGHAAATLRNEAIESIVTTEAHSPEDWTYLELPLIEMELMALSAALRGTEDITDERTLEEPLIFREEGGLIIARLVEPFIQMLARVKDADLPGLADLLDGFLG